MEVLVLNSNKSGKRYIFLALLVITLLAVSACTGAPKTEQKDPANKTSEQTPAAKEQIYQRAAVVTSADDAMTLLVDGNKRFTEGKELKKDLSLNRREDLATNGQKPFAVVVTCSDSRVPPELIFDQALGDLFVVRVAGNVVDDIAMGSIEYGVEHLKSPLLVIMGHEKCGAVKATVEGGEAPGSIGAIVDKIKPSVEKAKAAGATGEALNEKAADENVLAVLAEVEKSPIVEELVKHGKLKVVGAKYHIGSGEVVFNK